MNDELNDVIIETTTPIRVERITDYKLGEAVANRYGLWGPLEGERLLDFLEKITEATDLLDEARRDPANILRYLYRPPVGQEQVAEARKAASELMAKHRSIAEVLRVTDLHWDEWQRVMGGVRRTDVLWASITYDEWLEIERIILEKRDLSPNELAAAAGIGAGYAQTFSELYEMSRHRTTGIKMGRSLTVRQREGLRDMIRLGTRTKGERGGNRKIVEAMHEQFGVKITTSLVTKTRTRMAERGEL
jgi:hypothetical protein